MLLPFEAFVAPPVRSLTAVHIAVGKFLPVNSFAQNNDQQSDSKLKADAKKTF
jgi:hypothetical protein